MDKEKDQLVQWYGIRNQKVIKMVKLLKDKAIGDIVTYTELLNLLNIKAGLKDSINLIRPALYEARKILRDSEGHEWGAIINVGIKRLNNIETITSASSYIKRSRNSADQSLRVLSNVETKNLDQQNVAKHSAVTIAAIEIRKATDQFSNMKKFGHLEQLKAPNFTK